ncbi:zinc finger Ran-binding domain-containing protein [Aggregatilinea lenta]|uniref:zinc finger Ran-binding domain-containing protein n=1 Tax=Aggregatilinea lenta TaxID=913108 RepID=UPI000E5A2C1C|nr:Ran-binding zinc finger domain-containing protein [Aggregatilinea lenta]
MEQPKRCPACGQINAAENQVCVICKTPLYIVDLWPDAEPKAVWNPRVSRRERDEIILMYMRWANYATWFSYLVLAFGLLLLCGGSTVNLGATCVGGFITACSGAVAYYGPKVRHGLEAGETWPHDYIIAAHHLIYGFMGLLLFGLVLLSLNEPQERLKTTLLYLIGLSLIPFTGLAINWYAHRAFETLIGRRSGPIRRFAPLSNTDGRPTGVKVYTALMVFYSLIIVTIQYVVVHKELEDKPLDTTGSLLAYVLVFAIVIPLMALAVGVWRQRAWGRRMALIVHGAIAAFVIVMIFNGTIPGERIAQTMGGFLVNLYIWQWFRAHTDYFHR